MTNLTRILNNQIYSKTIIASQKIADGTITGSLFSSNVTVPGDLLISGNLFVLGTSAYTTIASTNTYVNDPLITLNNGFSGVNTYDEGLVFNRGSLQNRAIIWSEFNKEFRLIGTTETGTTYGNVNVSNYANLHIGNLTVDYTINHTGDLFTNGFINTTGNISGAVGLFGSINSTGLINTTGNISANEISVDSIDATGLINTIGNISASEGSFGTLNATGLINTTGNISAATVNAGQINTTGNVLASAIIGASINVSGNVVASTVLSQLVTADDGTFGNVDAGFIGNTGTQFTGSSINLSGNVLASTILGSYLTASTATIGNIAAVTIGNTGATVQGTTAQFSGNVIGGLAQFASINATPIGNIIASTGDFSTLTATSINSSGNIIAQIATFNSATINGNGTVTGYLNVTGNILGSAGTLNTLNLNSTTNATDSTSGALQVAGGAGFGKDVWIAGNLYVSNIFATSYNVLTVNDPLLYLTAANTYPYNYDIGFYSQFTGGAGNIYQHSGMVRDHNDGYWKLFSNVVAEPTGTIAFDADTKYDGIKAGNLVLTDSTAATSTTTGALRVAGGAGIVGSLVASQINSTGNVLAQTAIFNTVQVNGEVSITGNTIGGLGQFAAINSTPIGNSSASTGAFTTLSASAGIWANSTTDSTSTTTGSIVSAGGLGLAGNIFQGGTQLQTSAANFIFATTPTAVDAFKAASTLNIGANSGTLTLGNPTVVGTQSTQNLYNTAATTLNFAGAATTLIAGATSGVAHLRNANIWLPNATSLDGAQSDLDIFTQYATNANLLINANVTIGGNVGATTITNPLLRLGAGNVWFPTGGTLDLAKTGITTLNFANDSTAITIAATTGLTSVRNSLEAKGILYANSATETSSSTTGGLVVYRGAGIGGSLNVANSAVFNSGLTTGTFQIKSATSGNVALFANLSGGGATTESIIIGGANTVVQSGVTLKVGSTTTMMVPVGPSSTRPSNIYGVGYDVAGMVRFNSSTNVLEFYDGSAWISAGGNFTVISDRQFSGNVAGGFGNVDGTNTNFTLQSTSTTSSTIVSINGIMQFPTLAYSVSGTTLQFTEPPAPGDVIDARILTTTTTISALSNTNGYNQILADNTGVSVWTGSASTVQRLLVDTGGNINVQAGSKLTYDQTPKQVLNTNLTLLDSFGANTYTTAKYVVSIKQDTGNVQAMESLVTTNGYGAWASTSTTVNTGNTMGTLVANVSGGTCSLWLIPNSETAISNVKVLSTYIV